MLLDVVKISPFIILVLVLVLFLYIRLLNGYKETFSKQGGKDEKIINQFIVCTRKQPACGYILRSMSS